MAIRLGDYLVGLGGGVGFGVETGGGEGNAKAEGGAFACGGLEFHGAVMPLQDLISLRQANAAAVFFGGEVEFENFVLHFRRDAGTLVADFGDGGIFFTIRLDGELAALRHGLNSVDDDIEKGLLHEIEIGLDEQRFGKHDALDVDAVLFGFGISEERDIVEQAAEINFDQMEFAGAHEVDQSLHDAVETVNFAADDVHVAAGIGIELGELVLQKLQMENDRIDG